MALVSASYLAALCQIRLPKSAKCTQARYDQRPWCQPHSRAERKLHRYYKATSQALLSWPSPEVTFSAIESCDSPDIVRDWYEDCRKKIVVTRRAIQARKKHHEMFYGGPDFGHSIYIDQLATQETLLEELMTALDDRAYSLYVDDSDAVWLSDGYMKRPHQSTQHNTSAAESSSYEDQDEDQDAGEWHQVNAIEIAWKDEGHEQSVVAISSDITPDSPQSTPALDAPRARDDGESSDEDDDDLDTLDIDELLKAETPVYENVCECCRHIELVEKRESTYQQRLLNYFTYADLFAKSEDPTDVSFARDVVSNMFRQVIARIPPLLVRAKASGCEDVEEFLKGDHLQEHEHARLWRSMKHKDGIQEGKIVPDMIRHALVDAEKLRPESDAKTVPFVDLLGGRVWKVAHEGPMPFRCWDHFYNFVYCNCCADAIMRDVNEWTNFQYNSVEGGRWSGWQQEGQTHYEDCLRRDRFTVYWHEQEGGLKIEHIKPRVRGVKNVYIETEIRNWIYLRRPIGDAKIDCDDRDLLDWAKEVEGKTKLRVFHWTPETRQRRDEEHNSLKDIWVERIRSGNTLAARKTARWTNKQEFCCRNCLHKHMMTHAPNTRLGAQAKTMDFLIVDMSDGKDQNPEKFLKRINDLFQVPEYKVPEDDTPAGMALAYARTSWKMGRKMFRESLYYKGS